MTNALILDISNKSLLINNIKSGKQRWEFPGGKLDGWKTLVECVIGELKEELNIDIKLLDIVGNYKTQTPEGEFLCRTYFSDIIKGSPKIMEPGKHDEFDYFDYKGLLKLKDQKVLVPNLVRALPELKKYII